MARPCGNSKAARLSTCHHHQENLTSLLTEVFLPVIMADRRVLCFSVVLSCFLVFASYISNLTYLNWFSNAQAQTWERFSSTHAAYLVEFELDPSAYLEWTGGHVVICRCKRFQKSHVAYYSNCMSDVSLVRGGDIHPQPGPTRQCKESAKFDIPKALKANVINSLTWLSSPWNQERISVSLKTPYCKMASLSSPYLKCGQIYLCLTQASIDLVC